MADIVLAEFRGQAWLVGGDQYIDDLLANTLPADVSIELVACESKTEVDALWIQNNGPPEEFSQPWLIHPGVTNRVRRSLANHNSVFFAQWSAMLDEDAKMVIKSAAGWAAENPNRGVVLIRYVAPDGPQPMADLANLRAGLIEAELVTLGVQPSRITRETRDVSTVPGMAQESQRVDVMLKAE